jgi:glucose-1-phosphatase
MHRAVFFDLGNVLVHFDFRRGYAALEGLCPYGQDEIPLRLAPTGLFEQFESGQLEPGEFFERMRTVLALRVDYPGFCRIWNSIFTHALVPEALLAGLAARYRLVLLSNTNAIHFEFLQASYPDLLQHFHHLVLSYQVRAVKPRRAIYEAALARAGCPAGECFYTDDVPEYVAAARELGIDAVRFESAGQIARELRSRGIARDT